MTEKNAYAQSGVDVEAGYEVVERIKKHVARTERAGVMGALGGVGLEPPDQPQRVLSGAR